MSKLLSDLPTTKNNPQLENPERSVISINTIFYLVLAIFLLLIVNTFFIVGTQLGVNPLIQSESQQVLNEIYALVEVDREIQPVVQRIANVEQLISENPIQAEVYGNAKNGDYLIGYPDSMLIYNRNLRRVIYNGPYPNQLATESLNKLAQNIVTLAKEQDLIDNDYVLENDKSSQISVVANPETLKASNPSFYGDVELGDLLLILPDAEFVVIYRESENSIVNHGRFSTTIN